MPSPTKTIRNCTVLLVLGLLPATYSQTPSGVLAEEATPPRVARGQIELMVADPDGNPVENANVKAGFYNPKDRDPSWLKTKTNERGRCVVTGLTENLINYQVTKGGFYQTKGKYNCYSRYEKPRVADGYWQPRKPTVHVELRPIRNPIPMYVKNASTGVPKANEALGYDLLQGDWIAPHGKGKTADITILVQGKYEDVYHRWSELTLRFLNEHDGLISVEVPDEKYRNESEYWLPLYEAPDKGYKRKYTHSFRIWGDERKNVKQRKDVHYVFRIRTVVDKNGNVVEAMHGKIHNEIRGGFSWGGPSVGFTYYLNPTGTRNLEYAPPKNLFLQKEDGTFRRPSSPWAREHDEYIRGRP